jgi:hypothetical protein
MAYDERGRKGDAAKKDTEQRIKDQEKILIERKALVNNTLKEIKVSTAVR